MSSPFSGGKSSFPPLLTLEEGEEITDELRHHLSRIRVGHNLTSVLNSPSNAQASSPSSTDLSFTFQSLTRQLFDSISDNISNSISSADPTPTVLPSVIPSVSLQDFDAYRKSASSSVDRFLYHHSPNAGPVTDINRNGHAIAEQRQKDLAEKQQRAQRELEARSGGVSRDGEELSAQLLGLCFTSVPSRFFHEDFHLDLPNEVETQTGAFQLQQRLSTWLDIVEVCLWKQTTSQAQSFFNSLSDLRSLAMQVKDACATIADLRRQLACIRNVLAVKQLTVLRMKRRKENTEALITLANLAKQVRSTLPSVDALLAVSHDYGGALEMIQEAKKVLKEDLNGVKSLRTLARQLDDYEDMIGERLTANFVDVCVSWEVGEDALQKEKDKDKLIGTFQPIVNGLLRIQREQMHAVLEQYRKRVVEEVQTCAKDSVVEALSAMQTDLDSDLEEDQEQEEADATEKETEKPQTSAQQLVTLRSGEFISFLKLVFYNLEMVMNRAYHVHLNLSTVLERVVEASTEKLDAARVEKLEAESQEIVAVVCDLAQQSVKQLLTARADVHATYRMEELKELWDVVLEFCLVGDEMGRKKWFDLRGTLLIQAKRFLEVLHEKQTHSLYAVLDGEEWKQAEIPFEIQAIVNRIVKGKLDAPRGFHATEKDSSASPATKLRRAKSSKSSTKELVVQGKPYRVVSSVLMLITYLERCLLCSHNFANLSSSVLSRIVEILRLFNERTNSLVLQAEACKTAGLKRINTKNLALACQSLTVIIELSPAVMRVLKSSLQPKLHGHLTNEIDRIVGELETHQKRIYGKFLDMIDHLMHHCCEDLMREVQWDARTADGLGKPQNYMTKLTHGVTSMHNVLCKMMSEKQVQEIFAPIFDLFNTKIPEAFANVDPSTPTGRSRVRVDIKHLLSTLRRLRGLSGPGEALDEFLAKKFGSSAQGPSITGGSSAESKEEAGGNDSEDKQLEKAESKGEGPVETTQANGSIPNEGEDAVTKDDDIVEEADQGDGPLENGAEKIGDAVSKTS